MPTHGGDVNANALMVALLAGEDFTLPTIDLSDAAYSLPSDVGSALYQNVVKISNEDLTTKVVDGTGTFDVIMSGFKAHLKEEYAQGRISGAEYTKAFIALTEAAMGNAVQFLLGKDAAFWQANQAQAAAITARVQLAIAKVQYASLLLEAMTNRANYALTKLKLATEDITFASAQYSLDNLLPAQLALLQEQKEAQRAQTTNTRSDGSTIAGVLGTQKDLYVQQIVSYQRDAEVKAAKIFTDAWITMKTIEEGLVPPSNFNNSSLDAILETLKNNNGIGL